MLNVSRYIERLLWLICALAICLFAFERASAKRLADKDVAAFLASLETDAPAPLTAPSPDQADWSQARISAYAGSEEPDTFEGVLHIPQLGVSAPIRAGTDADTLNVAVGRVEWGAQVNGEGNLILAGHRDSFFRRLGSLTRGDALIVETKTGQREFVVESTSIVDPTDVDAIVLTDESTITLVTCYPFYFVGPAPKRFLVFGHLISSQP